MKIFQRNTNISYVKALFIRDYILNLFLFLSKWIFLLFISRWGIDFILKIIVSRLSKYQSMDDKIFPLQNQASPTRCEDSLEIADLILT